MPVDVARAGCTTGTGVTLSGCADGWSSPSRLADTCAEYGAEDCAEDCAEDGAEDWAGDCSGAGVGPDGRNVRGAGAAGATSTGLAAEGEGECEGTCEGVSGVAASDPGAAEASGVAAATFCCAAGATAPLMEPNDLSARMAMASAMLMSPAENAAGLRDIMDWP
jgi:hypothetical protein